jgi:hypothetical protein
MLRSIIMLAASAIPLWTNISTSNAFPLESRAIYSPANLVIADLTGPYINQSNGGRCSVHRDGRSYIFTNENGSWARFVFADYDRLVQVEGQWDRSVCATVQHDRGRIVLTFDSPNAPSGYWVSAG